MANNLIKPIRGVIVGSSGQTITGTCVDDDGVAQDISGYTTLTVVAVSPDRKKTVTATASYKNPPGDGSTGLITWVWAIGNIDRPGIWEIQLELRTPGSELTKSYVGTMQVGKALREMVDT